MPASTPLVQMVSKPCAPPWDDSGKNLVREQADHADRYRYRIMTTAGYAHPDARVESEPLYGSSGTYAPGLRQNLKALRRALFASGASILHYFFAPNPVSSRAGRIVKALGRKPSVQTVSSAPKQWEGASRLFFGDRIIALSSDTRSRILDAGVDEHRVALVRPGVTPLEVSEERRARAREPLARGRDVPILLYPGDLEFSDAARTIADALPAIRARSGAVVVFACRPKTGAAAAAEQALRRRIDEAGCGAMVDFVGRVEDMPALLAASDAVVLPTEDLYAKMDLPLVIPEAMSLGKPVVVADAAPINEIAETGGVIAVPARDPAALAEALIGLATDAGRRRRLGDEARAAMHRHFTATRMAREVELVYDALLEETR